MANATRIISDPCFFACVPVPTASAAATNLKYKRSDSHHTVTHKNTKIVATLGPASSSRSILSHLILAGVDMFRFNFSHGTQEEKCELHSNIRQLSNEFHRPVAILADLQGPKFRTGKNEGGQPILVKKGERVHLVTSEKQQLSRPGSICTGTPHADICVRHLQPGQLVLINDGAVVLKVIERVSTEEIICQVIVGGPVGERKGINTPDLHVPVPALTEKDTEDALLALQLGVEWMALSFVQHPDDVIKLRELIKAHPSTEFPPPRIIAKIEKPQAIENIDEIIKVVDGIMVARGDLGVECALETVPLLQKLLIDKSNAAYKLCITATQMLESMTSNPFPTRAEVSDVANAVCDGTDAVMLSGETAVGQYPIDTVSMMASIVHNTERSIYAMSASLRVPHLTGVQHAILQSAVTTANGMSAKAIILVCISYEMGVYMSKLRPPCPVIAIVFVEELARQLSPCFSLHPIIFPDPTVDTTTDRFLVDVETTLATNSLINKWLQKDALVVLVSGASPLPGMTNSLQVHRMGSAARKLESLLSPAIALRRLQSMPLTSMMLRQEEEKKSQPLQQTQSSQSEQIIQSVAEKAAADAIDETLNWAHQAIQEGSQH